MNLRLTMIVVVLAVIAAVVAIVKINAPTKTTQATQATGTRLLSPELFDPDKVVRITLENEGQPRNVFQKTDDTWTMIEPFNARMSNFSIRMLTTMASDLTVNSTIPVNDLTGDLATDKLGLAPARAVLTYDTDDSQVRLYLGRVLAGGQAYIRTEPDGNVSIVEDKLHRRIFDGDLSDWRVRNIFDAVSTEASRLTFERREPGKTMSLSRIEGQWMMQLPISTAADAAAVSQLISRLGTMRAASIIDDAPSDVGAFGLRDPWSTVTIETDKAAADETVNTKREVLLLGNPFDVSGSARYGQYEGRPSVFKVSAADVNTLTPSAADFVAKAPVPIVRTDVKQITIDGPDGRFTVARQRDKWIVSIEGGADQEGDSDRIALLLNLLTSPATSVAIPADSESTGAFLARATVEGLSGKTSRKITISRLDTDGNIQAVLADGSGALRFKDAQALVDFTADAYLADESARRGHDQTPPNEPIK